MKNTLILCFLLAYTFTIARAQKSSSESRALGNPILCDSTSTFIIPTLYNSGLFSSGKLLLWGDFYSNILFYNFKTDTYKKLFDHDTYIRNFSRSKFIYYSDKKPVNATSGNLVFYLVNNKDLNKNGEIDSEDPTYLYVSDWHGDNLKLLSPENENVIGYEIFEKQNLAMVKLQTDENKDGRFNSKDNNYYFIKLDLNTLSWGNKIELK